MGPLRTFSGHTAPVLSVCFLEDDRFVLSASADGTVALWDTVVGNAVKSFQFDAPVLCVTTGSPGTGIAGDDRGRLTRWALASGETLGALDLGRGPVRTVAFEPSKLLVVVGDEAGSISVVAEAFLIPVTQNSFAHVGRINSIHLCPQRNLAVSGGQDRQIRLWAIEERTLRLLHECRAEIPEQGEVQSVFVSPDGRSLLSGGHPHVKSWALERPPTEDVPSSAREVGIVDTDGDIFSVALSVDGRFALAGRSDHKVTFSSVHEPPASGGPAGVLVRELIGHEGRVRSVALSRDHRRAISASEDMTVRLWDLSG
jgi:WD40 repeat protein